MRVFFFSLLLVLALGVQAGSVFAARPVLPTVSCCAAPGKSSICAGCVAAHPGSHLCCAVSQVEGVIADSAGATKPRGLALRYGLSDDAFALRNERPLLPPPKQV